VAAVKCATVLHVHYYVVIFCLVLWHHGLYVNIWKWSVAHTSGHRWCDILHYNWWTASIKRIVLFSQCMLCFMRTIPFRINSYKTLSLDTMIWLKILQKIFFTTVFTSVCSVRVWSSNTFDKILNALFCSVTSSYIKNFSLLKTTRTLNGCCTLTGNEYTGL